MNGPQKYRKEPVVIEALEWTGENLDEMERFLGCGLIASSTPINESTGYLVEHNQQMHLMIRTLEGDHRANVGDYVIKGIKGEFYPCKPDIFGATYSKVE